MSFLYVWPLINHHPFIWFFFRLKKKKLFQPILFFSRRYIFGYVHVESVREFQSIDLLKKYFYIIFPDLSIHFVTREPIQRNKRKIERVKKINKKPDGLDLISTVVSGLLRDNDKCLGRTIWEDHGRTQETKWWGVGGTPLCRGKKYTFTDNYSFYLLCFGANRLILVNWLYLWSWRRDQHLHSLFSLFRFVSFHFSSGFFYSHGDI